jgi:hypothetical protein
MILLKRLINESFKIGKSWFVHEGTNNVTTIFESGEKMQFKLRLNGKYGSEKDKWRHQAANRWSSIAREIYNDADLNEIGNPIQKSWKECFSEALKDPRMVPFVDANQNQPIF